MSTADWIVKANNALNDLENMRPNRIEFDSDEAYLTAWRWYRDNAMVLQHHLESMRESAVSRLAEDRHAGEEGA